MSNEATEAPDACDIVVIDGSSTLAAVIIRTGENGKIVLEAWANGMRKDDAAYVLRHIARMWDEEAAQEEAESRAKTETAP